MDQLIINQKKEMRVILEQEIKNSQGSICIQAGHFALVGGQESNLIPGIFEDIKDANIQESVKHHPYMGYLPLTTFNLGASLVKYGTTLKKNIKLLLIVNDWQWIKKINEISPSERREKFYLENGLPESYKNELKKNELHENIFIPFKNKDDNIINNFFFSESILRDQFDKFYATSCPVNNSCAQEYVPMLSKLEDEGINLLISFIPRTCQLAVNEGTQKFKDVYESKIRVINIFVNGIYNKNFWEDAVINIF